MMQWSCPGLYLSPLEHRVLLVLINTAEAIKDMRDMLVNLSSDKFGNNMR